VPFLQPGQTLTPRFRLVSAVGRGGMGEVWSAWDEELTEHVALKVVRTELARQPAMVDLLRHECRSARRLVHPNIVRVYDFHRAGGHAFISMEYIEGYDLERLRGASYQQVIAALLPVLDALTYAHGLGVIHRDVKASNVLVDTAGVPRLVDFGIAAALNAGGQSPRTGGSPNTMSPQQRAGESPTPADDVYACGALLRDLLTDPLPPAEPSRRPIAGALARVIGQCLAESPSDRPGSAAELRRLLEPFLEADRNSTVPPQPNEDTRMPARPSSPALSRKPRAASPAGPSSEPAARPGRRKTVPARLIAPVFLLLVAAALAVFLWLPDYTAERHRLAPRPAEEPPTPVVSRTAPEPPPAVPSPVAEVPAVPPATAAPSPEERRAAEDALGGFLKAHAALEAKGIDLWGGEAYAQARDLAARGDEAMRREDFPVAERDYRQATELLAGVAARTGAVLEAAVSAGARALDEGDGPGARSAFRIALAIAPEDPRARRGMARAEKVEEVFRLLAAGEAHERGGRLALAHTDFEAAAGVDPESAPARAAVARIREAIAADKFRRAMSDGLQALEDERYPEALAAFQVAHAFQPESREVNDGITQAREGIRLERIAGHHRRAKASERQERWTEAVAQYEAALAIDPTLTFAQEGKARGLHLAELTARMQHYLDDPGLLSSPRVRQTVATLMGEAAALVPKGPRFARQLAALQEQFELAVKPVTLELVSDNATEVVIYRIGRLGRFTSHQLSLRPGTYTIVGSRLGYKDVRREVTLAAGQPIAPVFIACKETI
jgi:tetratricopeptide (TPR) repeat protein